MRGGRTWAISACRGSYKPLFLLSSGHFSLEVKATSVLNFGLLKSSESLWFKFLPSFQFLGSRNTGFCTLVLVFGVQEHLPKAPFWKPPFSKPRIEQSSLKLIHAQYDWTTGAPDNGNEWRKFRAVPCLYPLRSLPLYFV